MCLDYNKILLTLKEGDNVYDHFKLDEEDEYSIEGDIYCHELITDFVKRSSLFKDDGTFTLDNIDVVEMVPYMMLHHRNTPFSINLNTFNDYFIEYMYETFDHCNVHFTFEKDEMIEDEFKSRKHVHIDISLNKWFEMISEFVYWKDMFGFIEDCKYKGVYYHEYVRAPYYVLFQRSNEPVFKNLSRVVVSSINGNHSNMSYNQIFENIFDECATFINPKHVEIDLKTCSRLKYINFSYNKEHFNIELKLYHDHIMINNEKYDKEVQYVKDDIKLTINNNKIIFTR